MVSSFLDRFAPIDFTRYIDRLTDRFTGREWLFEQIDQWLQQQGKEQFYLLTGEPGVGKSAIVAQLIKRWQAQPENAEQGKLAAYHFCRAGDVETVRPGRVLRSIAAQLGNTLPHYGKALNKVLKDVHLNIDVNINIGNLTNSQVTGIYVENLKDLDPREELRLLIQAPLAELPAIYEREGTELPALKVFLIDSLDEAVTTTGRDNVATLLAALSQSSDLPPWIRFVLTARPNSSALKGFESIQPYKLEEMFSKNLDDIEQYVGDRIQEDIDRPKSFLVFWWKWYWKFEKELLADEQKLNQWFFCLLQHLVTRSTQSEFNLQTRLEQAELPVKTLIDKIRTLSEGNFLYTRLVMDGISTGELSLKNLSALPKNLYEVYQRFLRHRCSVRKWINLYQPLLGTLTVTQEAISSVQLAKFAKVTSDQVEGVPQVESAIAILQQFLDEVEDEQGHKLYTIFHQSLREYLLDRKHNHDFWCDAKEQHENIIEYCKGESKDWEDLRAIDVYGLRHLAQHLVNGDRVDELHQLLSREKDGCNAWFDAKDDIAETAGFLIDVGLAWAQADKAYDSELERSIGLQCRYALMVTSVNSRTKDIPSTLLVSLVQKMPKEWTPTRSLAYVRLIPDPQQRSETMRTLAAHLAEPYRHQAFQEALNSAQLVQDKSSRVKTMVSLGPYLPESLLEALNAVQSIQDEDTYAEVLATLVHHLPKALLPEALKAAQVIENEYARTQVMIGLASLASESLLLEIFNAAQALAYEPHLAEALVILAPHLPEALLSEALKVAQEIKNVYACVRALIGLAPYLSTPQLSEVLKMALTIQYEDEYPKTQALIGLAPYLSMPQLSEAFQAALNIQDEMSRTRAVTALAPYLPEALNEAFKAAPLIYEEFVQEIWTVLAPHLPEAMLAKALKAAQTIQDESVSIQILTALAPYLSEALNEAFKIALTNQDQGALITLIPYLPKALLLEALKITEVIRDGSTCTELLLALASYLPEALPKALKAIEAIQDKSFQTEDLTTLAPHLPETLLLEALKITEVIRDGSTCTQILLALAPYLPEALPEALKAIEAIQDESLRAEALTTLAPHLPDVLLLEALKVTQAIQSESACVKALIALVPYLPKATLSEALKIAQTIQEKFWCALAMKALVPYLPEALPEALYLAQAFQSEHKWHDCRSFLTDIAPYLPKALQVKAFKIAQGVRDEWTRAQILVALIPLLPKALLADILKIAQASQNEFARIEILTKLAAYLPKSLLSQALNVAQEVQEIYGRAQVLTALAPRLPKALLEAFKVAQSIPANPWGPRAQAFRALLPYLPEALPHALDAARAIESAGSRVKFLAGLAPYQPNVLPEALETAQAMQDVRDRANALSYLVPYLPKALLPEVLNAARITQNSNARAKILTVLAPHLPEALPEALNAAQAIEVKHHIEDLSLAEILIALAPNLSADLLPEAFKAAQAIQDVNDRVKALTALAPYLIKYDTSLFSLWNNLLHSLSSCTRKDLFLTIQALTPIIFVLGGEEGIQQNVFAIQDVERWWK